MVDKVRPDDNDIEIEPDNFSGVYQMYLLTRWREGDQKAGRDLMIILNRLAGKLIKRKMLQYQGICRILGDDYVRNELWAICNESIAKGVMNFDLEKGQNNKVTSYVSLHIKNGCNVFFRYYLTKKREKLLQTRSWEALRRSEDGETSGDEFIESEYQSDPSVDIEDLEDKVLACQVAITSKIILGLVLNNLDFQMFKKILLEGGKFKYSAQELGLSEANLHYRFRKVRNAISKVLTSLTINSRSPNPEFLKTRIDSTNLEKLEKVGIFFDPDRIDLSEFKTEFYTTIFQTKDGKWISGYDLTNNTDLIEEIKGYADILEDRVVLPDEEEGDVIGSLRRPENLKKIFDMFEVRIVEGRWEVFEYNKNLILKGKKLKVQGKLLTVKAVLKKLNLDSNGRIIEDIQKLLRLIFGEKISFNLNFQKIRVKKEVNGTEEFLLAVLSSTDFDDSELDIILRDESIHSLNALYLQTDPRTTLEIKMLCHCARREIARVLGKDKWVSTYQMAGEVKDRISVTLRGERIEWDKFKERRNYYAKLIAIGFNIQWPAPETGTPEWEKNRRMIQELTQKDFIDLGLGKAFSAGDFQDVVHLKEFLFCNEYNLNASQNTEDQAIDWSEFRNNRIKHAIDVANQIGIPFPPKSNEDIMEGQKQLKKVTWDDLVAYRWGFNNANSHRFQNLKEFLTFLFPEYQLNGILKVRRDWSSIEKALGNIDEVLSENGIELDEVDYETLRRLKLQTPIHRCGFFPNGFREAIEAVRDFRKSKYVI